MLECCHHLSRRKYVPDKKGPVSGASSGLYSNRASPATQRKLIPDTNDIESLAGKPAVVTLLLGETKDAVSKLPFSLYSLASSIGKFTILLTSSKMKIKPYIQIHNIQITGTA